MDDHQQIASALVAIGIPGAAGVTGSTAFYQEVEAGSRPSVALQAPQFGAKELAVKPIHAKAARTICEGRHYLKSYPGGVLMNFEIFVKGALMGIAVLNAGSDNLGLRAQVLWKSWRTFPNTMF